MQHLQGGTTMIRIGLLILFWVDLVHCLPLVQVDDGSRPQPAPEELDVSYWNDMAEEELQRALQRKWNTNEARNVIMFIGDGMSLSTVTASRIHKGQNKGHTGEEEKLVFEDFPGVGLLKTYNYDAQVSASAATATQLFCGVKATYGTIGLGPRSTRGNCSLSKEHSLTCIAEHAMRTGKAAGVVTTARVSHATPAAIYANSAERNWEADKDLTPEAKANGCPDIAAQLMEEPARDFKVILGGGRRNVFPISEVDPEYPTKSGLRTDARNIVQEWMDEKTERGKHSEYVWNSTQFDAVDPDTTDYLMGLFEHSHMQYESDRAEDVGGEPSLAEMVEKSIKILGKNKKGYFLQVEGARIDHAHHDNLGRKALEDTIALDKAVEKALELVDLKNTLIIVTADHSSAMTITSYARRGNPILGLTDHSDDTSGDGLSDRDFMPYTVLSYSDGPGYTPRENLTGVDTTDKMYKQRALVPMRFATHEGTDVPVYATGAMSHLIHSTHEQQYVYHAASYAGCYDAARRHCNGKTPEYPVDPPECKDTSSGARGIMAVSAASLAAAIFSRLVAKQITP